MRDDKGKPQISIPQKSAVAIVPPKKVRPYLRLSPSASHLQPRSAGLFSGSARPTQKLTLRVPNRLFVPSTIIPRRIPKS